MKLLLNMKEDTSEWFFFFFFSFFFFFCWLLVHSWKIVLGQVEYFPVGSAFSKGGLEQKKI
jgi:IS4 transposase